VLELGEKFNYKLIDIMNFLKKNLNEKGVPFLKPSRVLTINKKYSQYKEIFTTNSDNEALAKYWFEKTLIGYSYSSPLINILKEHYPELRIETDNIDEVFDKVFASHPHLLHPNLNKVTLRPWGAKEFAIADKQVGIRFQQW
jgi:hypothetical protein